MKYDSSEDAKKLKDQKSVIVGRVKERLDLSKISGDDQLFLDNFLQVETLSLYRAANMVLTDHVPNDSRKRPLFVHVRFDHTDVIAKIASLYQNGAISEIWVDCTEGQSHKDKHLYPGGEPGACFQGYTFWKEQIVALGVPAEMVKETRLPSFNTPDEHLAMIDLAQDNNWDEVILVGVSYQLLRVALGTVKALENANFLSLKCYFAAPSVKSWTEDARVSALRRHLFIRRSH